MKYRLTEDWLEYKKGHVMEDDDKVDAFKAIRTLLLKTGIIEEAKEEEDPMTRLVFKTDALFKTHLLSENDQARRMFEFYVGDYIKSDAEKIKTLLLSLRK